MDWSAGWNEVMTLFEYAYWVAERMHFLVIIQAVFVMRLAFYFTSRLFNQ